MPWRTILKWSAISLVGVFLVIQFIPYGHAHDNPPVLAEPAWDSPTTRELAQRACFDCHSNETELALVHEHRSCVMAGDP